MPLRNTATQWGSVAKSLHWLMALLILAMFVLGWTAESYPMSPTKLKLFIWHKSTGLLILALALARLGWRLLGPTPDYPEAMAPWERRAASATHVILYAVMIAMPVSGWIINSAANFPLKWYGLFRVPNLTDPDKALQTVAETVHLTLFWLLATLLVVHVIAALRHHWLMRDDVLRRMLPFVRPTVNSSPSRTES